MTAFSIVTSAAKPPDSDIGQVICLRFIETMCRATKYLLLTLLVTSLCCMVIGQEVVTRVAPQLLPSKIRIPNDIPDLAYEEDTTTKGCVVYPALTYEKAYVIGWLKRIDQFASDPITDHTIVSSDIPRGQFALRGLIDGWTASSGWCEEQEDIADVKGLAKQLLEQLLPELPLLNGLLNLPAKISVPAHIDSCLYFNQTRESCTLVFPASHYRIQFVSRWNETLFNFGVRKLPLSECGKRIRVVAIPNELGIAQHETGCTACLQRLQFLLEFFPELEIRRCSEESIPRQTRIALEAWPGQGSILNP